MTPFESSMPTLNAAIWYSLHSFLLLYFLWVLLYREVRTDQLRSHLAVLAWEFSDAARTDPAWSDLAQTAIQIGLFADRFTLTRLLGAWLLARTVPEHNLPSPELSQARLRLAAAVAAHVHLPILSHSNRGFAAIRIAIETASLGR